MDKLTKIEPLPKQVEEWLVIKWQEDFLCNNQPERSKREDLVNLRLKCPNCLLEWEKDVNPIEDEIGICPRCLL
jgi:hypothetical protein